MEELHMLRSMFRVFFTLAFALSLIFQVFFGFGINLAYAASQPTPVASGYHPVASTPTDLGYCYPSGYNRQGWRCGWRLAMYPYPISTYNCGYYSGYYGNCGYNYGYNYGYNGGYNYGYGGRGYVADYGGQPRYNPCYYNNCYNPCYQYSNCYNPCYNTGNYCGGYR
jgi:hypothetical protein